MRCEFHSHTCRLLIWFVLKSAMKLQNINSIMTCERIPLVLNSSASPGLVIAIVTRNFLPVYTFPDLGSIEFLLRLRSTSAASSRSWSKLPEQIDLISAHNCIVVCPLSKRRHSLLIIACFTLIFYTDILRAMGCTIFSQGYSFMFSQRAPTQKTQKAPHRRPQTRSTENPTPQNPKPPPTKN